MGFVPLAYRAGSEKKRKGGRVHIFWQKRIRHGDVTTPWWFPSQTTGGSMRADRLVLPIPPGTHWSDAKPVVLPGTACEPRARAGGGAVDDQPRRGGRRGSPERIAALPKRQPISRISGLSFSPPPAPATLERPTRGRKPKAASGTSDRPRAKNDPRLVAVARELKDRWLEHLNSGAADLTDQGKYDVSRAVGRSPRPLPLDAQRLLALPCAEGRGMKPMAA
jgi:hypothetical protein